MQSQPISPRAPDAGTQLAPAVAVVFATLARAFDAKFAVARDPKAMMVWERTFAVAKLTPDQIRAGLAKACLLKWPPSVGEYVALCLPESPANADAMREAMAWARDAHAGEWSHPAVEAAARHVGSWYLRNSRAADLQKLWASTYADMLGRFARGEPMDAPVVRALEHSAKPPKFTTTPESDQRSRSIIDRIASRFGHVVDDQASEVAPT